MSAHYVAFPFARNTCLSLLLDQSFLSRAIIFLSIFSFSSIPTLFIQRLCKSFAIKRAMVSLSFSFTCIARLSTTLSTLYGIFKLDRETFFYLCIQISRICISSLAENAKFFHLNSISMLTAPVAIETTKIKISNWCWPLWLFDMLYIYIYLWRIFGRSILDTEYRSWIWM